MAIRETPVKQNSKLVRVAEKVKATKFSAGPEYKFVFKIESTTNPTWRAFFAESLPEASRFLLEEVRQDRKARYRPVYLHRAEIDIVCVPAELSSILDVVKSVICVANEKDAQHQIQLKELRENELQALNLAREAENRAEKKIQQFFAELEI